MKMEFKLEDGDASICAYSDGTRIGEITFFRTGDGDFVIDHTGVDQKHQGQNIGAELVKQVVALARAQGVKIIPECSFARVIFKRHPEFADVLAK